MGFRGGKKYGLAATLAFLTFSISSVAFATPLYSGLYVFGDSLSDTGNIYTVTSGTEPVSPPYSGGHFTNGKVWVQDLATTLGLGPVTPSLQGGHDFAYGGAQTGATKAHNANGFDLPSQLLQYKLQVTTPQPNALYALWIGSNDIDALAEGLLRGSLSPTDIGPDIQQAVANVGDLVSGLADSGMKNLLALNVPDLSKTPDALALAGGSPDPAAALAEIQGLSREFDNALGQELATLAQTDGLNLSTVDTFSAIDQIVAHPASFGLSEVSEPCWTGDFTDPTKGSVCSAPDSHLFWDGLHPTRAGHQLVANAALASLNGRTATVPEPGSLGMLLLGLLCMGVAVTRRRRAGIGAMD